MNLHKHSKLETNKKINEENGDYSTNTVELRFRRGRIEHTCGAVKCISERAASRTRTLGTSLELSEQFRSETEKATSPLAVVSEARRLDASAANRELISGDSGIGIRRGEIFPARKKRKRKGMF